MRIVVLGADGLLGRNTVWRLADSEHEVIALVDSSGDFDHTDFDPRAVWGSHGPNEWMTVDLFNSGQLSAIVADVQPEVIIHLATGLDCPDGLVGVVSEGGTERIVRLCNAGTKNVLQAARDFGVSRVITSSIAFGYRPHGYDILSEDAPLWTEAPGEWGNIVRAANALETAMFSEQGALPIVLRFGHLYGPRTCYAEGGWFHQRVREGKIPLIEGGVGLTSFTHVEDCAAAIAALLYSGDSCAYNVVDNEPSEAGEWLPAYAKLVGGPAPVWMSARRAETEIDWLTRFRLTEQRAATNFRLREALGWRPMWPSWREGFATLFGCWPG